jgi:hypothetical protein
MGKQPSFHGLRLLGVSVLLAGVVFATQAAAESKPKAAPKATAGSSAKKKATATNEELPLETAGLLCKAYVVLAGANHDYNGHRGRAMGHVKSGFASLAGSIQKNGNATQKAALKKDKASIAAADQAARRTKMFHEPQPQSDAALREAAAMLVEVRPALESHRQNKVLGEVDKAIAQINIAPKIR